MIFINKLVQTDIWIRETADYIADIGRRSQTCQTAEEANQLLGQLETYMKPRQREQEERMKRIETAAIMLYGKANY